MNGKIIFLSLTKLVLNLENQGCVGVIMHDNKSQYHSHLLQKMKTSVHSLHNKGHTSTQIQLIRQQPCSDQPKSCVWAIIKLVHIRNGVDNPLPHLNILRIRVL